MKKRKKKWHVYGTVTAGKYLGEFEAATADEAVEMALNSGEAYVSVCHQCAHEVEDPEIHEAHAEPIADDGGAK